MLLTKYYSGDQMEKNEMGGACSAWGRGNVHIEFWWGKLNERDHLLDPGVERKLILRPIIWKWDGAQGLVWSGSGQGRVAGSCKRSNILDDLWQQWTCGFQSAGDFLACWKLVSFSRTSLLHGLSYSAIPDDLWQLWSMTVVGNLRLWTSRLVWVFKSSLSLLDKGNCPVFREYSVLLYWSKNYLYFMAVICCLL